MVEIINIISGEYRKKYAKKNGIHSLMNAYHTSHWNDNISEKIYKYCLSNNIKWEEYLKIPLKNMIF